MWASGEIWKIVVHTIVIASKCKYQPSIWELCCCGVFFFFLVAKFNKFFWLFLIVVVHIYIFWLPWTKSVCPGHPSYWFVHLCPAHTINSLWSFTKVNITMKWSLVKTNVEMKLLNQKVRYNYKGFTFPVTHTLRSEWVRSKENELEEVHDHSSY